ncbi:ferredoxin [Nocardia tengchongensis]
MKLSVDRDRCAGTGMCGVIASELLEFGDDGRPVVLLDEIPAAEMLAVISAVQSCPTAALHLSDG